MHVFSLHQVAVRCLAMSEPVLLVGETGSGKTTVCQLIAALRNQVLHIANCHQNTETADLIGGLRPNRHENEGGSDNNEVNKVVHACMLACMNRLSCSLRRAPSFLI